MGLALPLVDVLVFLVGPVASYAMLYPSHPFPYLSPPSPLSPTNE